MQRMTARVGAYLLTGDPVWLRSSLSRYYDLLDDLVVLVPVPAIGWTGRPIPVDSCLEIIEELDVRGIARRVEGRWQDRAHPMRADTAQRQAGLDALAGHVDWVLQVDNDEVLPDAAALVTAVTSLPPSVMAVEWPMRVLYRHLGGSRYAAVTGASGAAVVEYPGPVAVRPRAHLSDARRVHEGSTVRFVVPGDDESLQVRHAPGPDEQRVEGVHPAQVILHNSWGRPADAIWRKTRTWGHAAGARGAAYFALRWWPSRWTWRWVRDLHPFSEGLWPRLRPLDVPLDLLDPRDRQ